MMRRMLPHRHVTRADGNAYILCTWIPLELIYCNKEGLHSASSVSCVPAFGTLVHCGLDVVG